MDDDRYRPPFGYSNGYSSSNRRSPPVSPFDDDEEDEGFGNFGEDIFSRFRFGNFGRNGNDMENIFRGAESMLRHMDSMFRDMHSMGGVGAGSFGQIMGPGVFDGQRAGADLSPYAKTKEVAGSESRYLGGPRSPRDEMLKVPDSESALMVLEPETEDSDGVVMRGHSEGRPGGWSSFRGSSSMTSFSGFGDGKTEEKRTIQNSDGSKSVIVTRRMGDKEWTITTKVDASGETEVEEDLVNMDEDEKEDFEAGWKSASPARYTDEYDGRDFGRDSQVRPAAPILDRHAPSIFSKLFGSWFG